MPHLAAIDRAARCPGATMLADGAGSDGLGLFLDVRLGSDDVAHMGDGKSAAAAKPIGYSAFSALPTNQCLERPKKRTWHHCYWPSLPGS